MAPLPKILAWLPVPRNTLLGFAKVEFPSGLIINDVTILSGDRGPWAAPPSKVIAGRDGAIMKDDKGKVRYLPIIEFVSKEARNKWSDSVIEALRAAHPDVFEP